MTDDLPDHTNYSLIKATDESGNVVTVLVDASGRIVSVMTGDYSGATKTLAVDSAGRMITVIRDPTNDRYVAVDSNGYLGAILKAAADVNVQGSVPVDQNATEREMQGKEGATLRTVAVDSGGRIIMVPRGDSGYYLAVDSNGNIVSVMKGDYAGALKTLAVDTQGRIQAVLTDPEDVFGNPNYIGAGELAARLGSIKSFDKRGEILFMDDFEDTTLKWEVDGSGTGWAVARSNAFAKTKDYSMKLTAGNAEDNAAYMDHYHYFPVKKSIGAELSFALGSDLKIIETTLHLYSGAYYYAASCRYWPQLDKLYVEHAPSGWVEVASDVDLYEHDNLFHALKIVIDLDTEKWVRVMLNDVEYDVSAESIWKATNTTTPYLFNRIQLYNNAAGNHYAYIDDVVLTQNEP